MKINENAIRRLIRESIRTSLKEATWFNSDDEDYPANTYNDKKFSKEMISNRVIFFDDQDRYSISGMTHGRDSHVLKHAFSANNATSDIDGENLS